MYFFDGDGGDSSDGLRIDKRNCLPARGGNAHGRGVGSADGAVVRRAHHAERFTHHNGDSYRPGVGAAV